MTEENKPIYHRILLEFTCESDEHEDVVSDKVFDLIWSLLIPYFDDVEIAMYAITGQNMKQGPYDDAIDAEVIPPINWDLVPEPFSWKEVKEDEGGTGIFFKRCWQDFEVPDEESEGF